MRIVSKAVCVTATLKCRGVEAIAKADDPGITGHAFHLIPGHEYQISRRQSHIVLQLSRFFDAQIQLVDFREIRIDSAIQENLGLSSGYLYTAGENDGLQGRHVFSYFDLLRLVHLTGDYHIEVLEIGDLNIDFRVRQVLRLLINDELSRLLQPLAGDLEASD